MDPTTFNIPTKVRWKTDLSKSWQELFYPSLIKKLSHAESSFKEIFEIQDKQLTPDLFLNVFIPLYDKEISNRPDYHLNRQEQIDRIIGLVNSGEQYRLYAIFEKSTGEFAGGYIYRLREDFIAAAFRVFDRELTGKYKFNNKFGITVDFWVEAQFLTHIKKYDKSYFTPGRDSHPRIGGIGLSLYKLKTGSKPYLPIPEEYGLKTFTEGKFAKSDVPIFFFDELNESNQFTHAQLFFNDQANESVINEFQAILTWAQIKLSLHKS